MSFRFPLLAFLLGCLLLVLPAHAQQPPPVPPGPPGTVPILMEVRGLRCQACIQDIHKRIKRYPEIVKTDLSIKKQLLTMWAKSTFDQYVSLEHGISEAGGAIQMFEVKMLIPQSVHGALGVKELDGPKLTALEERLQAVAGVRQVVIDPNRWFASEKGMDVGGCVVFADTNPRLERELVQGAKAAGFIFEPSSHGGHGGGDDHDEWSEMNHAFSGLCLLLLAFLGTLQLILRRPPWLIQYGTVFIWITLFIFLFIRSDRNAWPLGRLGWIESFQDWDTAQHRLGIGILLLIAIGAALRIRGNIQVNPILSRWTILVIGLIGSGMLFTHLHSTIDPTHYAVTARMNAQHMAMATFALLFTLSKFAWDTWQVPRKWGRFLWLFCLGALGAVLILYVE